jgi:hypothetical protein
MDGGVTEKGKGKGKGGTERVMTVRMRTRMIMRVTRRVEVVFWS